MKNKYSQLTEISLLNSAISGAGDLKRIFDDGYLSDKSKWDDIEITPDIPGALDCIPSRIKYSMSKLSLGVYNVLDKGPGKTLREDEEVYLFTGFAEIYTVNQIGNLIMIEDYSINPAIFPNSVNHISLSYYTILNKKPNYLAAITDGLDTGKSFVNYFKRRICLPESFVVCAGEEDSGFFLFESGDRLKIKHTYIAYRVNPGTESGVRYLGFYKEPEDVIKLFPGYAAIFADGVSFGEFKGSCLDKVHSEYPLCGDNPSAPAVRMALPTLLDIKGLSLVINKSETGYDLYESLN